MTMDRRFTDAWLPPGQTPTARFPVVGETEAIAGWDRAGLRLELSGSVERPLRLSFDQLLALPQSERTVDIHCVTGWSRRAVRLRGVPLAVLLAQAGVQPQARFVRFVAATARAHDTTLPLELARDATWLVHEMDGTPLAAEHGGPLRSVTPGRYFYKSLKWLARVELLTADAPGYWERESAYHNEADPWREQRFDDSRVASAEEVQDLRAATDFAPWRGRVLIKARLGGWTPKTPDLSGLQLKCCSLRKARLAGAQICGANFSLSNFEGAELRGTLFSACDLEGASFAGADLRDASMQDVALSATRFFRDFGGGRRLEARVEGLRLEGHHGLLEDQAGFLRSRGARL
jgi:DMSO/TMAO reductase YedYZ molybdopterin-dependent catalytic subunit